MTAEPLVYCGVHLATSHVILFCSKKIVVMQYTFTVQETRITRSKRDVSDGVQWHHCVSNVGERHATKSGECSSQMSAGEY